MSRVLQTTFKSRNDFWEKILVELGLWNSVIWVMEVSTLVVLENTYFCLKFNMSNENSLCFENKNNNNA